MKRSTQLAILHAAAWLGLTSTLPGQSFKLDSIHYDSFGGLVQLRWESQPGRIYSIHSSTNLATWDELGTGLQPIRIQAVSGCRTQVELDVPAGNRRFWRIGMRPITDLGTLTPGSSYYPAVKDLNDDSRVVGAYATAVSSIGFTWKPGKEVFSFGPNSAAVAVNKTGVVAGYRSGTFFSWTESGGVVELGAGTAVDINEAGHILGLDDSGAFLWKPGIGKTRIPDLSSVEPYTVPAALSDAGQVVGVSLIDGNYYRAFLWTESGGLIDLTASLSSAASGAVDINSSGQVVGYRTISDGSTRAFSWSATGGFVTFPPGCYITDLSENGKVVGRGYLVGNQAHAFSWTQSGGIVDLGDGVAEHVNELGQTVGSRNNSAILWSPGGGQSELEGLSTQEAQAILINNNGVIVGVSRLSNTLAPHVVMWTTTPVPQESIITPWSCFSK